jgi:hypothetical protein
MIETYAAAIPTWQDSALVMVGENRLGEVIRTGIGDLADRFLNAYLTQNPKK